MRYQSVAEAYRDLEGASARLELIDRLARLFTETPTELLPTVALLCQGQIAPDFAGVELGLAERLAARAVAEAAGVTAEQALADGGLDERGVQGLPVRRLQQEYRREQVLGRLRERDPLARPWTPKPAAESTTTGTPNRRTAGSSRRTWRPPPM